MKATIWFDVETGGLNPRTDALLEIGMKFMDVIGRIDDAHLRIPVQAEGRRVTEEALKVNKIDMIEHAKTARSRKEAAEITLAWIENHLHQTPDTRLRLAGHNVDFDREFLNELLSTEVVDTLFSHRHLDTASILQFFADRGTIPDKATSLEGAANYFGLEPVAHTALDDVLTTIDIYRILLHHDD